MKPFLFHWTPEQRDDIDRIATATGRSRADVIRVFIDRGLRDMAALESVMPLDEAVETIKEASIAALRESQEGRARQRSTLAAVSQCQGGS